MKKINRTEISMDDYKRIEGKIDSMINEEELVEAHKSLVFKFCKNDYYEIKDCGVQFIKIFLSRDWGRTIVYNYSEGAKKFIKSKYLSDYFKASINELLSDEKLTTEAINAINSDKEINDMSEDELNIIYSSIKEFYAKQRIRETDNVANYFMSLLQKLDGKGVIAFIKNNINNINLASHILTTSGLCDSASYYSGCGVNYSDLNEENLIAIFKKLFRLDSNYAIEFVNMVNKMKTLGATEFINSFKKFATNNFKLDNLKTEDSNISLDGVYGKTRDTVAVISIFSAINRGNDINYQINASEQIKRSFLSRIKPVLIEIDPIFFDSDEKSSNSYEYKKRR